MRAQRHSGGFTYLVVLFAVVLIGLVLASTGQVWHAASQREKERELLWTGQQFRKAIAAYYDLSPGGAKRFPRALDDLLADDRYPTLRRHLRKVYSDPMTSKAEWGLIKAPDGGIMGVHSLSGDVPRKIANFAPTEQGFEEAATVADWKFVYQGTPGTAQDGSVPPPALVAGPNQMTPGLLTPMPQSEASPTAPHLSECERQRVTDQRACTNASQDQPPRPASQCLASATARFVACTQGSRLPPLRASTSP